MEQKLFVGNLSWGTSNETLTSFISEFGINSLDVEVQYHNGRSKGWALVTVEGDAKAALSQLNEQELDGRPLVVRFDRNQSNVRAPRQAQERAPRGDLDDDSSADPKSLFIGNLPWSVTSEALSEFLGIPAEVTVGFDGRSRGYGVANCQSADEAQQITSNFNGADFDGRQLVVKVNRPSGRRAPRRDRAQGKPNSLYIGNLSWSVTSEELSEHLDLEAEVVMGYDGRSRGYAIANCNSAEEAQEVIRLFNGVEFAGRELTVKANRN